MTAIIKSTFKCEKCGRQFKCEWPEYYVIEKGKITIFCLKHQKELKKIVEKFKAKKIYYW